ncbi:uncharacterized protein EAF01_011895 [Botrytis porri]|nr:uncharacterized protein EAF01_011895 [Botrytis porri]KAF7881384.1 hypothetical protein EAF01_011895 [Botrytis porri]
MSYSWYNETAIARKTRQASTDNDFTILQTILIALGALLVFGILDNITPIWKALGLESNSEYFQPLETEEYIIIEDDQKGTDESQRPLMTPAEPRRNSRGRGRKQVQDEDSLTTPTTLRRSSRVREREAKNGLLTPVPTPTAPARSARAKSKGKRKNILTESFDDFYEPVPTPTGQKKIIKGREKQIVLDEYEAFMNEPEEKKSKKSSEVDFDYEGYSTP